MKIKSQRWVLIDKWQGTEAGQAFNSLEKVFALEGEIVTRDKQSSVVRAVFGNKIFYVKRYHKSSG